MAAPLLVRNRNYRLLFAAGALTNLGDGMVALALPWLATLLTRDPMAIATVAAASRLPWLFFAIPAGVIVDRTDRRKLVAQADMLRAVLVAAILMLALAGPVQGAVWVLAGLAFLLGSAEVLRDNAAQTILPSIVASEDLETANGQLWSAEQLTGQFLGPPLAGALIAIGIAIPFGVDLGALVLAAGLVWMISLKPQVAAPGRFFAAMAEGIRFMRGDPMLLRLAVILGLSNFLAMAVLTVQVLFAQEVLGLTAAEYGVVLSVAAAGAMSGSLGAGRMIRLFGRQACLFLALAVWMAGYAAVGLCQSGMAMAASLFAIMAAAMLWNVITVSWRQRRIPAPILGRVNSIYRFFGWGSMPLGAMAAGLLVAALEADWGREVALRAPFMFAAGLSLGVLFYAVARLRLD
ncbi:MFS transporter [Thioclava sp. FR2]|uniref:MFS transporter n=1 Tax=Thioclava sp. FR2 TaxID=3445780 RepID=UPI003EBD4B91